MAQCHLCRSDFLDMVFLDGDHRYETVTDDIKERTCRDCAHGFLLLSDPAFHDFSIVFFAFQRGILTKFDIFADVMRFGGRSSAVAAF